MRIGQGWDIHRLIKKRALILGGVIIPSAIGEDGHSDGDVLVHALIDALLGALCLGDIGAHFPPSDPEYKNISSLILLEKTLCLVRSLGYSLVNADMTVILEKPKLRPYIEKIRTSLAQALNADIDCISVKAKTAEGCGEIGKNKAVEAQAVVLLAPKS